MTSRTLSHIALFLLAPAGCAESVPVEDDGDEVLVDDRGDIPDDPGSPGGGGSGPDEVVGKSQQGLGEQLSLARVMALAHEAGLACDRLTMAGAVAMAESEGWTAATHQNGASGDCPSGSTDRGIWQINDCYWPMFDDACAFDPACNASAMAIISGDGESFQLWSSVTPDGTYAAWLDEAEAALHAVPGCGGSEEPDAGDDPPPAGGDGAAECDALGYTGACIDQVAIWSEDGTCWVRDCAGEGKSCGLISLSEGYGCVEGPAGSTKHDCADRGYAGECLGDVLVWAEDGACRTVDCAATGRACVAVGGAVGHDCG